MDIAVESTEFSQLRDELRNSWQGRVLAAATGRMAVVVPSVLSHTYEDAMPTLFNAVLPPAWDRAKQSIRTPFLTSIGKINKRGQIVANAMLNDFELPQRDVVVFANTLDFQSEFRLLADRLKLCDADRIELFKVANRWLAADQRLDPAMDPADPDARRLTVN